MPARRFLVNRSSNLNDVALLIFRVMFGASLFLHHGWEKLTGFSRMAQHFPNPLHIGVYPTLAYATFADGICSLLVILGLVTRIASLCILINLAVVFFIVQRALSFSWLPGAPAGARPGGEIELVFVYLAGYLLLFLAGPGKFSLDAMIG